MQLHSIEDHPQNEKANFTKENNEKMHEQSAMGKNESRGRKEETCKRRAKQSVRAMHLRSTHDLCNMTQFTCLAKCLRQFETEGQIL